MCAVSGVTICFGGILRDTICKRDVALGSQSFAAATAAGAIVYVGLREACLLGVALPLSVRVLASSGTVVAVRLLDYARVCADMEPLLPPMHGRPAKLRTMLAAAEEDSAREQGELPVRRRPTDGSFD